MRINTRLISKGIKRKPGDTEKELEMLKRQTDIFKKMIKAANNIVEAFMNFGKMLVDALIPIFNSIGDMILEIGGEKSEQSVTQQLPEFPKLHRFRQDLL